MLMISVIVLVIGLSPASEAATAPPATPLVYENWCIFEYGCEFTQPWVVLDSLAAYADRGDSTVAFRLMPGDSVTYVRGDLVVERLGKVLVLSSESGYTPGDTVYVTGCDSEGSCSTWARGQVGSVEQSWCGHGDWGKLLEPRKEAWWVRFSRPHGRDGWLRLGNSEECGFIYLEELDIHSKWEWD